MKLRDIAVALATMLALASAGRAAALCQPGKIAEFPVTMHGLAPWTTIQINGHEASFTVDSGAFYSSITPAKAAELQLYLQSAPFGLYVQGVGGAAQRLDMTTVTLGLAGQSVPGIQFLVMGQGGGGSAGLLGQNILHLADADYDLAHGAVRLIDPRDCRGEAVAYWTKNHPDFIDLVEGEARDPHTYGYVAVNGVRLKAVFDTGANSTIIFSHAAARAGLRPDMEGARTTGVSSGIGAARVRTWSVPVASFKIGEEEIKNTRIQIEGGDVEDWDMLLGADFFLAHHVYVANRQGKIYFTYIGGNVFNLTAPPPRAAPMTDPAATASAAPGATGGEASAPAASSAPGDPKDADAYSRRGAARAAEKDYESAVADFSKAIALKPDDGRYYLQRAQARMGLKQAFLAMADLDEALKRDPADVDALVARAEMRFAGQDRAGAARDLDAASAAAAAQADIRIRMAADEERLERFDQVVAELDRWIPVHLDEAQTPAGYRMRCWARLNLGRELDKALDDCNRAIRGERDPINLRNRGLVYLRRGEHDRAIGDFNAALALNAKMPWVLYGRGVAELYKGEAAAGEADIAAARALAPKITEAAQALGVAPPGVTPPPGPRQSPPT
jgi:tetratricopeptide (TPR) repeat protein/predicted aspartyl protease